MQITKILIYIFFTILITGCTNQHILQTSKKSLNTNIQKPKDDYKLTEKEIEFLNILEQDSYASLCNEQNQFIEIKKLSNQKEQSIRLRELFYQYTNNLANSCIDKEAFDEKLKEPLYKKRKQNYEYHEVSIDKQKLLEKYDNNSSVKAILDSYAPTHPKFFRLIKMLDIDKLSSKQYNRLRLNVERLKLLKDFKSDNFVQLNIPSYDFSFYENGVLNRSFGTVVGELNSQTPILSSNLSHFIVNPAWNIPDSIAKNTIIPRALKNRNYLRSKNIVIREDYNLDSKKINFSSVNWKKYLKKDVKYIPYKFIQLPSRTNGMGKVKFMFPNEHAVYMHDTIGTWRFGINKEKIRSASHGCIRLEHPISFMKYLTQKYTPETYKSVRTSYLLNRMKSVDLSKELPIHITYLTSYIKDGKLKFYDDIYGYDEIQKLNFIPYANAKLFAQLKIK